MITKVKYKRRRQSKTDYHARLVMLKGRTPRVIIRKTNRYIIIELAESKEAQDFVLLTLTSKELLKYGWPALSLGSLKSLTASYLTGFLFAKKSKEKKAIIDLGLQRSTKGSRLYAAIKGLSDGGMEVSCDKKMFPEQKMFKSNLEIIKKNIEGLK